MRLTEPDCRRQDMHTVFDTEDGPKNSSGVFVDFLSWRSVMVAGD